MMAVSSLVNGAKTISGRSEGPRVCGGFPCYNFSMNARLNEIVKRIEQILLNENNDSLDTLGSYIVGATIVRDDYDFYKNKYQLLDEIAELGADLETIKDSKAEVVLNNIESKLSLLRQELAKK